MSETVDVLRGWFDAHRAGDRDRARALMAPAAIVRAADVRLSGFDAFMAWYDARRAVDASFGYEVIDLLGGGAHAVALIELSDAEHTWRQVALYRIVDGQITAIDLYEDERHP